jgi:nicotinamidase-related amidase
MTIERLDPRTALVVIDLQIGITAAPVVDSADDVVANAARLAAEFRERGLPVALVRTTFSTDRADAVSVRADAARRISVAAPDFADLRPELGLDDDDITITKRQWDAFYGTELDLQLRRRGTTGIVLCGISTSIGVESTARTANSHGYELAIATDACTDTNSSAQENSLTVIFPRISQLGTTAEILSALPA